MTTRITVEVPVDVPLVRVIIFDGEACNSLNDETYFLMASQTGSFHIYGSKQLIVEEWEQKE